MKGISAKLSPKQTKAILSLLGTPTMAAAATDAGISEVTLWRYLQDRAFQDAYRRARHDTVSQAMSRLQKTATEAVETLRKIMLDEEKPPTSRVTAARTILDFSIKAFEVEELEARLEKLEATMNTR